jgi:SPP1 gp7 family putative phage head morphogenesis protein
MMEYVHQYLKNNQEAILRGDSAALVRQDATPGGSYSRMVKSLYGWYTTYIPPLNDEGKQDKPPIIFMGLGNIAESMNDFNSAQWEKASKAELGVEFPVYEEWWPGTKRAWQEENYRLIHKMTGDYISQINSAVERAVTAGWSPAQLAKEIQKIDGNIKDGRANLIARDQIGKLNGRVTQARMEAVGLELYEWSTSGDERVRDSHEKLDGKLCRWDDPSVYSDDGGKTWKDRPSDWCQLHPGYDIQCRCTALFYWAELVEEVDREIDLLAQNGDTISSGEDGLRVMDRPPVKTKDELLREQREAAEQQRREANARATEKTAKKDYSSETWLAASTVQKKLRHMNLPKNLEGISIAESKFPMNKDDERTLLKEVKQAVVLRDRGASVYLIPKAKDAQGNNIPGPDAIVNGKIFEFKTITGGIGKVEKHFRDSRKQGGNAYLRITDPKITRDDVIRKLSGVVNNDDYTGGFKGDVFFTVGEGKSERTYFLRVKDLKR